MEPLKTNRQCFIFLRILSADESTTRRQRIVHVIFSTTVLIGLMSIMAATLAFGWKYASIDLGRSIFAFLFSLAEFVMIYMVSVGLILLRHKIGSIFDNLSAIYKDSKYFFALDKTAPFDIIFITALYLYRLKTKMPNPFAFWHAQIAPVNGCGKFISRLWQSYSL